MTAQERPTPGRVILIVLDGCGVGAMPDADRYGDVGADTLGNTLRATGVRLPNLERLGLGALVNAPSVPPVSFPLASVGRMHEASLGKDTATGHWELMGVVTQTPFITFPGGFPAELIGRFEAATGRGVLGNIPASGTEIIQSLGDEHCATGKLIVYTSADSVFQIAAHEDVVPLEELYRCCQLAYDLVTPEGVARVIARPFKGSSGKYTRTENRHDYTVPPPKPTVMDALVAHGVDVTGVGKIKDIYAARGVSFHVKATNNRDITERTIEVVQSERSGLIFANLVDFDMLFGHRRNVDGFSSALLAFDTALPRLIAAMRPDDLLLLTADHGNDPTFPGTDHSREQVPVLAFQLRRGAAGRSGTDLGTRTSFADIGATIAAYFQAPNPGAGTSFLGEVWDGDTT